MLLVAMVMDWQNPASAKGSPEVILWPHLWHGQKTNQTLLESVFG